MDQTPGITRGTTGVDGIVWNVLGQTYVPKQLCEASFSWHATVPPDKFVPVHIHPTQDEYIYVLEGQLDLELDGADLQAEPGDLVCLPRGVPHGYFNRSDRTIKTLFWVAPSRRLYDLFWALHSLGPDANPADVVATSAAHEVDFLPPKE